MNGPALQFSEADLIGLVASVDTTKVLVDVSKSQLLTRVGIGNLVAIRGATEREYLIAITERVTRTLREELQDAPDEQVDEMFIGAAPSDLLRAVLVGTYRTVDGSRTNTFKRGADSFPQIDRECFFIEGANLQRFMGLLGTEFSEKERLKPGHFVIDRSACAIASGDRFFQRHAAILGSTGSGKSWAVALLLERASQLRFPNLIVFDMHGEYTLLCGLDGFAKRFRIAGPGDIENPADEVLFLPYWLLNREEMLSMLLDLRRERAESSSAVHTARPKSEARHAGNSREGRGEEDVHGRLAHPLQNRIAA